MVYELYINEAIEVKKEMKEGRRERKGGDREEPSDTVDST